MATQNTVNDQFPLQPKSDELPAAFRAYNLAKIVELLAGEQPELARKVLNDDPDAAQALGQFAESKLRDLQQSLGPAKKSAPKSGKPNGRRPAFNENNDLTRRAAEILRSR